MQQKGLFLAYFDTNAVEDLHGLRNGVDTPLAEDVRRAIRHGRLAVPFSDAVARELVLILRSDKRKAIALGRFYFGLASLNFTLRGSGALLWSEIAAHLGDTTPPPYERATARQRRAVKARLFGRAPGSVDQIVDDVSIAAQGWIDACKGYRDKARTMMPLEELDARTPVKVAVAGLWPRIAPDWARGLAKGRGLLERLEAAGLGDEILSIRGVRAAVGVAVGLASCQVMNNRNPHRGDYGDFEHCAIAASARLPLVTSDDNLCKLVAAIPEPSPLRVMSLRDVVAEVAAG